MGLLTIRENGSADYQGKGDQWDQLIISAKGTNGTNWLSVQRGPMGPTDFQCKGDQWDQLAISAK